MLADYRDVFARCLAKPLPPFEAYEATVEGTQRYQTDYALRRFQIDDATRCALTSAFQLKPGEPSMFSAGRVPC